MLNDDNHDEISDPIDYDLYKNLWQDDLNHLEDEFENYKLIYPNESDITPR